MAGYHSVRKTKKRIRKLPGHAAVGVRRPKKRKFKAPTKRNPTSTIIGWVRAKAVKIVRNKAGKAVSVKIKT